MAIRWPVGPAVRSVGTGLGVDSSCDASPAPALGRRLLADSRMLDVSGRFDDRQNIGGFIDAIALGIRNLRDDSLVGQRVDRVVDYEFTRGRTSLVTEDYG